MGSLIARSRPLHLDGAIQRVDDTRKIRQKAVARRADDPPAMGRDQRVDGAAELAQRLMRTCLVLTHQTAETDHIRMQDGGELPLPTTSSRISAIGPGRRRAIKSDAHRECQFDLAADEAHYIGDGIG